MRNQLIKLKQINGIIQYNKFDAKTQFFFLLILIVGLIQCVWSVSSICLMMFVFIPSRMQIHIILESLFLNQLVQMQNLLLVSSFCSKYCAVHLTFWHCHSWNELIAFDYLKYSKLMVLRTKHNLNHGFQIQLQEQRVANA